MSDDWDSFAPPPPGTHPPLDSPGVPLDRACRHPQPRRRCGSTRPRPTRTELTGPVFGEGAVDRRRRRPDDRARRRGGRPADHRHRAAARRRRATDPSLAGRDLAGQRVGPLPPPQRPVAGHARPQLHRRRARAHRRRRHATGSRRSARAPTRGATTPTPGARRTSTSRCSAGRSPSASSPRCTSPTTRCSSRTRSSTPSPTRRPASASSPATTTTSTDAGVGARLPLRHRRARPGGDAVRGADRWLSRRRLTPSQTVGPFLHLALADPALRLRRRRRRARARSRISGAVVDGDGAPGARRRDRDVAGRRPVRPLPDRRRRPVGGAHRQAAGRADASTARPQAPHLVVSVFARGLLDRVVTRIYFADEDAANAADPTLAVVGAERRAPARRRPRRARAVPFRHPPAG